MIFTNIKEPCYGIIGSIHVNKTSEQKVIALV